MKGTERARVLSRGKSFEFSEWQPLVQYTNDCFTQDFVSLNGALLACVKSHTSERPPNLLYEDANDPTLATDVDSEYWALVVSGAKGAIGPKGDKGEKGDPGKSYMPGEGISITNDKINVNVNPKDQFIHVSENGLSFNSIELESSISNSINNAFKWSKLMLDNPE